MGRKVDLKRIEALMSAAIAELMGVVSDYSMRIESDGNGGQRCVIVWDASGWHGELELSRIGDLTAKDLGGVLKFIEMTRPTTETEKA